MEIGRVGKMEKVGEIDIKEQVRDEDMYKGGKIQISRKQEDRERQRKGLDR